ncbi:unnamed protein product [Protopolystoma xenopodis]|uniref:Exonuclease domain-containing protein n=1 Tax=Protopolystoma xenopodis TaxID=117903 RepID=A0A448WS13_9PLAT|nr:unnamed protein product [Protopolystoma xenopodis]
MHLHFFVRPTRRVALDCEFVGVGLDGREDVLARVSLVNQHGQILLDLYVRPKERVVDFRTRVSGIRSSDLRSDGPAVTFEEATSRLAELLKNRILIGHSLTNDFKFNLH